MKAAVKKKWLAALRSDEYRQGRGRLLRRSKGKEYYCCLGVLAAVCGLDPHEVGYEQILKADVAESLGLRNQSALALMNDDGHSFSEIADYIEADL